MNELSMFNSENFMPHGMCYLWQPNILWPSVISDVATTLAYFVFTAAVVYFVKKRSDLPSPWFFILAGAIVFVACGSSHLVSAIVIWEPIYGVLSVVKVITAVSSVLASFTLWYLMPVFLSIPSASMLRVKNDELVATQLLLEQKNNELLIIQNDLENQVKERTQELYKNRYSLRTIIDTIPSMIFVKNLEGKVIAANKAMAQRFSMTVNQLIGKFQMDIEADKAEVKAMLADDQEVARSDNETFTKQESYFDDDGNMHWLQTIKRSCTTDAFDEQVIIGIAVDITNLKNTELQLSQANQQLIEHKAHLELRVNERTEELEDSVKIKISMTEQLIESEKMASLGRLVAGVAHELNTPLGNCLTATSYISEINTELEDKLANNQLNKGSLKEYISANQESQKIILTSLQRASTLVDSFKQVAVEESADDKRSIKLTQYIRQVSLLPIAGTRYNRHEIYVYGNSDLLVDASPTAIAQIFSHLVSNAVTHAYDEEDVGEITISIKSSNQGIKISISDDGKGMAQEQIDNIFEPFYTTQRSRGCVGLGMHIVFNLVKQSLGGSITCSSKLGKGTQLEIVFPF